MKNVFLSQGKPRTDKVKRELKFFIAMEIAKNP
jgi:hypothetical protein